MELEYKEWLGRPVILKIALEDLEVSLRGKFLRENPKTISIRIDGSWDIEIYKTMILAVGEDDMACSI